MTTTAELETEPDEELLPPRSLFGWWITLAVIAVLAAVILAGALVLENRPATKGVTTQEQSAADAAGQLVVNLSTYSRANFAKDWALAISGLTGPLVQQEQAEKATTLATLQQGKFDIKGTVIDTAVVSSAGKNVQLLVVLQGYRVSGSQSVLTNISRVTVTATRVGSKWLLSSLTNVPLGMSDIDLTEERSGADDTVPAVPSVPSQAARKRQRARQIGRKVTGPATRTKVPADAAPAPVDDPGDQLADHAVPEVEPVRATDPAPRTGNEPESQGTPAARRPRRRGVVNVPVGPVTALGESSRTESSHAESTDSADAPSIDEPTVASALLVEDAPSTSEEPSTKPGPAVDPTGPDSAEDSDTAEDSEDATLLRYEPRSKLALAAIGVVAAIVVAALVVDGLLLAGRPWSRQSTSQVRQRVVAAAKADVVHLLSYDYRHIQQDVALTLAGATGTFKAQYQKAITEQVLPDAAVKKPQVAGQVTNVGVQSTASSGKQMTLLVFAQQTTVSASQPTPTISPLQLRVTMDLVHGQWLLSNLVTRGS